MTPRIPPLPPEDRDEQTAELLQSLSGGADLNIFATLAHHPKLLKRWSAFGGTLLLRGMLPPRDRELLILRTAWLTAAEYEWGQHVRIAQGSGVSAEEVDRLVGPLSPEAWSEDDAALLAAADELHHSSRITDETWALLARRYDAAQLIELCMVVGQYHLVAFTLNSLGVEPEAGVPGFPD